ncbi:MAG: phosphoglycerate kinase [Candidatus Doudnabacteria bacterium]|nr:phosphoglycerate kinase [Candidatus Doudnabacteria bacterium]
MAIKYLKSSSIKNNMVILRPDLNCPIEDGKVSDDFRIQESLPTIRLLIKNRNKLIICGHEGRPKGQWKEEMSFRPVAKHLANMLGLKFIETSGKIPDYGINHLIFYTGDLREKGHLEQIKSVPEKDVVFLENMRFYPEEENNDAGFAKSLASLAEVFVLDGFGVAHHPAVSVTGLAKHLASYAGFLLEKEIKFLDAVLKHAKKPFVVMTGGIKLSEKVGALENLGNKADKILVGGGVASLMFKTKGYEVGFSRIEEAESKIAWQIMQNFKDKLVFPLDVVVANKSMDKESIRVCLPHEVSPAEQILDAGPKTILEFSKHIKAAKTIVWSGPLGLYEKRPFHHATFALARLIGGRGKGRAFVVAGGGDTVDAIRQTHQFEHIDHVSTGGGAMLEYLAGRKLPGIEALK